ncbi:MAG: hypothetical protein Q8R55_01200 [Candidatus Taylorbacteria bacterium]|nr:hypothetical protein [Candidatus Taylorbacteria bacterium]
MPEKQNQVVNVPMAALPGSEISRFKKAAMPQLEILLPGLPLSERIRNIYYLAKLKVLI